MPAQMGGALPVVSERHGWPEQLSTIDPNDSGRCGGFSWQEWRPRAWASRTYLPAVTRPDNQLPHELPFYSILYYTILYYTILYYTILYYTILYYTILYYTILYYTILLYAEVWPPRLPSFGGVHDTPGQLDGGA